MSITCFKLSTGHAAHEGSTKHSGYKECSPWSGDSPGKFYIPLDGRQAHHCWLRHVTFSHQGSSFVLGDVLTFSVLQKMFIPKKCLPIPCQAEILLTHVEPLSLLESVCLGAMTLSRSAQTFINKLKDFITICQLWCHCLLEQETLRLISLESSPIRI